MSGHSKWSKLKHSKGAIDSARGKVFTKLLKEIQVAAKLGGGDPTGNARLRVAIDKARANSIPKDTIERSVARGSGDLGGESFEKLMYEGYGPGGVAILVSCLTDNRSRTAGEVRNAFTRAGANIASPGAVSYMFQQKGIFALPKDGLDEDTVMTAALEGGADDVSEDGERWSVIAPFESYDACRRALEELGVEVSGEVSYEPENRVELDAETAQKLVRLIERIEDLDDVQETFTNAEWSDEVLAEIE